MGDGEDESGEDKIPPKHVLFHCRKVMYTDDFILIQPDGGKTRFCETCFGRVLKKNKSKKRHGCSDPKAHLSSDFEVLTALGTSTKPVGSGENECEVEFVKLQYMPSFVPEHLVSEALIKEFKREGHPLDYEPYNNTQGIFELVKPPKRIQNILESSNGEKREEFVQELRKLDQSKLRTKLITAFTRKKIDLKEKQFGVEIEMVTGKIITKSYSKRRFKCKLCNRPFRFKQSRERHQKSCPGEVDGKYHFMPARAILAKVTKDGRNFYLIDWLPSEVPLQFVSSVGPYKSMLERSKGKDVHLKEVAITHDLIRILEWEFFHGEDYDGDLFRSRGTLPLYHNHFKHTLS